MNTEHLELLKEDLVTIQLGRPDRKEAEIMATRIVDSITDLAKQMAEEIMDEHNQRREHKWWEQD